ncbi:MAG TPA: metal ABC transporter permease [Thermoleophilaceae bacterium]|nr:metal ABC transporter permease [Thermoleophilaceae bacterium]
MIDFLTGPLESGIDRRALLEVVLLGLLCGPLSFWVRSFRLAYPSESLAHGLLPGLVLASLAGAPLIVGAAGGVAVAAVAVAIASRDRRIGSDTATAVVVSGAFGLGGLLALRPDAPARLEELLFGDPLGVSAADLAAAGALALAGGAALAVLHRPLTAVAFDAGGAGALGLRPGRVRLALLLVLATAVAVAVQGLGSLLVLAVLVAPAMAVGDRVRSPGRAMAAGAAVAVGAGVVGLYSSFHLGGAAGASVALALCAAAAGGAALGRLRRPAAPPPRAA